MRIIFFGTPEFAVATLKVMAENGYMPVAVVTAPDKPAGRGLKLTASPVKVFARELGIEVFQPSNLKDPDFLNVLRVIKPDVQVVVAFRMLPEVVWNAPPLGTWNLHASLLPKYRGAAPINHAIINGETETGLTTFKLKQEIDTGEIAISKKIVIGKDETAGELHDRMMNEGATLMLDTLRAIEKGEIQLRSQEENASYSLPLAPKLTPAFCKLDLSKNAFQIHNLIRGLSPFPGVSANLTNGGNVFPVKIYRSKVFSLTQPEFDPGTLISDGKSYLRLVCHGGILELTELQFAGKKRLSVQDILRGFHLLQGARLM